MVDDGVSGRGHRTNMMNSAWGALGVSTCNHASFGYEAVMPYAVEIADNATTKGMISAQTGGTPTGYTG